VKTISDVLDRVRERRGGISDYRIAKDLGLQRTNVYEWRAGRSKPPEWVQLQLAEWGEIDPAVVATIVAAGRAKSDKMSAALKRAAERLQLAIVLILLGGFGGAPAPAKPAASSPGYTLCAITGAFTAQSTLH
jgi:hypothetical protein